MRLYCYIMAMFAGINGAFFNPHRPITWLNGFVMLFCLQRIASYWFDAIRHNAECDKGVKEAAK